MTCPTCRRDDMPETCGSHDGKACGCCGMIIVAEHQPEPEKVEQDLPEGTNESSES